ncbi:metal-dependent hydrolase [Halorussus salilacus]|uniref:metal-dependent hydrolase n=1 Tax=Halorussus salilacus TaxID=2953750 RepID=UPI00209E374F|nr:metal-dependent hydrolase [Halorussus salilacus]USZ67410.1 metal-dependent hydrolase [Halorussus salilacus]
MPDLLAHALFAYALGLLLSWRYAWLSPAYVTVVMAGAFVPDLSKAELLVPSTAVEAALGVPFDWFALHTAGGVFVAIALGATVVARAERGRVAALLSVGAVSHLLADGLLLKPSGRSYAIGWPVSQYHPPTPGLYLSTQPDPAVAAAAFAAAVWLATRYRRGSE